jgi:hypothetical protein
MIRVWFPVASHFSLCHHSHSSSDIQRPFYALGMISHFPRSKHKYSSTSNADIRKAQSFTSTSFIHLLGISGYAWHNFTITLHFTLLLGTSMTIWFYHFLQCQVQQWDKDRTNHAINLYILGMRWKLCQNAKCRMWHRWTENVTVECNFNYQ